MATTSVALVCRGSRAAGPGRAQGTRTEPTLHARALVPNNINIIFIKHVLGHMPDMHVLALACAQANGAQCSDAVAAVHDLMAHAVPMT